LIERVSLSVCPSAIRHRYSIFEFILVVRLRYVCAGIGAVMALPDLEADPAELVLADASHVDASLVFLDALLHMGHFCVTS
jgi:hypothetical protein